MHTNHPQTEHLRSKGRLRDLFAKSAALVALAAAIAITPCVHAGEQVSDGKAMTPPPTDILGSKITGLLNLEFSDHYITPRGLDVENQGLVFQPLLLLFVDLYSSKDGFLNDVTLDLGVWNSIHSRESGAKPGSWNEIDGISGLTFKFMQQWQFDVYYTLFRSQTDSYKTSENLDFKLTYHDNWFGDSFSINPYVEYFWEVCQKATVVLDPPKSSRSGYLQIGIDPTLKLKNCPLTFELPTFFNIVGRDFYQKFDGSAGGSGVGVVSTEFKVSTPLSFIPKSYGIWTVYAGVQYYHLFNDGLLDGNIALGATAQRKENLVQYHGGLTIFF